MNFRWTYSTNGTDFEEVCKPGITAPLFAWDVDPNSNRVSKRLVLQTSLAFDRSNEDYARFYFLLQQSSPCAPIWFRYEVYCDQEWKDAWTGRAAIGGGRWDHSNCKWTIKPEVVDRYSCAQAKQDVKRNVLGAPAYTVNTIGLPSNVQIWATTASVGTVSPYGWDLVDTQSMTFPTIGTCGTIIVGATQTVNIFWRQVIDVPCIGGVGYPPAGTGWTLISTDLTENGGGGPGSAPVCPNGRRYVRTPLVTWPFPNDPVVQGPVVDFDYGTTPVPYEEPSSPACGQWMRIGHRTASCQGIGLYVCLDTALDITSVTGRRLVDCIELLTDNLGCGVVGVRSDFFDWNAVGDAPGYSPGYNYVTGALSQVNNLILQQKSDTALPSATNPATIGELSFKEMMTILFGMFRVLWDIDEDGYVRIEHWKYWRAQDGLDLTAMPNAHEALIYEALSIETPRVERAKMAEAFGRDFVGMDIVYSGACISADSKAEEEVLLTNVTTDIGYIISDPDLIDKKGFVLLACQANGGQFDTIVDYGAITGSFIANAPLSWANLQRDFWTWDRYQRNGNMNGQDVTFDGARPDVQQSEVIVLCHECELLRFLPEKRITSKLGNEYFDGAKGMVERASFDHLGHLSLTLRYSR